MKAGLHVVFMTSVLMRGTLGSVKKQSKYFCIEQCFCIAKPKLADLVPTVRFWYSLLSPAPSLLSAPQPLPHPDALTAPHDPSYSFPFPTQPDVHITLFHLISFIASHSFPPLSRHQADNPLSPIGLCIVEYNQSGTYGI